MESNKSKGKTHVCPIDKRQFPTKAALRQHEKDSHVMRGAVPKKTTTPRKIRNNQSFTGLAAPKTVVSNSSDTAMLAGCDRVAHIPSVDVYDHGSTVVDELIGPAMFERLKIVAEAFQKVQYLSLSFEVVPYLPSTTSGGYVAAVVRDPTDLGPIGRGAEVKLAWLSSQQGAVSTKLWQPANLSVPLTGTFYTSDSSEIRESSPGRFVVMMDGKASQNGSITVFARWRVRLSHASLEPPQSLTVKYSAAKDLWTRDGHRGLFYRVKKSDGTYDWRDDVVSQITPSPSVGMVFELPYPLGFMDETSVLKYANWLQVNSASDLVLCPDGPSEPFLGDCKGTSLLLRAGVILSKFELPETGFQRESCAPFQGDHRSSSQHSLEPCSSTRQGDSIAHTNAELKELLISLTSLLQRSHISEQRSPQRRARSLSMGSCSSMEYLPK